MEPSTTNTFLSDHIIKALCNTLMHSLWQGLLLALITGAIVIFTKKASAAYRYNLLVGAMALFSLGIALTFIWQLQKSAANSNPQLSYTYTPGTHIAGTNAAVAQIFGTYTTDTHISHALPLSAKTSGPMARQTDTGNITETVISYFNTHYNIIVLIWFLIICAKSIQMAVGLHGVFHLKRTKVFAVGKDWEERLLQLAEQLRIKQTIRLLESGIAKVPMVIGHLKPVILIPIGLINSLNTDEVEAILIHELAHIRRRDYLVNLLQSFMEIVFFFNPAVLWISQLIKTERENCCDDLAIAQSRNTENYIRALLSCEEYKAAGPNFAMAFPGSKNTLLDRVKRMVGNRNHSLNMFEKTVLTICLVAFGLGVSAFTARESIKKVIKSVAAVIQHDVKAGSKSLIKAVNDTTLKKQPAPVNSSAALLSQLQKPALSGTDTGKSIGVSALKLLTDKIDSARRNTGTVQSPLAALAKLDTTNFKKFHEIGLELYRERLVVDTDHLNISLDEHELIVNGVRMPDEVFQRIYTKFGKKGENGRSYGINYENGNSYGINYTDRYGPSGAPEPPPIIVPDFGDTLVKYGVIKDKRHIHAIFNSHGLIINGVKQPDDVFQMLFKKYGESTNITYTNNGSPDTRMEQNAYWADRQRKIIDQMQREGLIDNRKDLSFSLTDKKFVINGKVQGEDVFQRYRNEYVPANAVNWHWGYNGPREVYYSPQNGGLYYATPWAAAGYNSPDEWSRAQSEEQKRVEDERDKKLVADLLQDGLITDPNNVTFSLSDKGVTINGKKQSDEVYKKYKEKYVPNDSGGDWSWTYKHHE